MRLPKQSKQSAPRCWSADRQHKCRVEDISSNSDHIPETETGDSFQFSVATIQVKKNLSKVLPAKVSRQRAVVAGPPLMEGEQDGTFLSNSYSWESKQISFHQLDQEGELDWLSHNEINVGAIQSLKRYCSVLERQQGSDYNNLLLKAAMCRRFRVEDRTELESQTLKRQKGRKRRRECDSNVSVCLHFSPILKAGFIIQEGNRDSITGRYEDTAQIFYCRCPSPQFPLGYYYWTLLN